MTLYIYVNVQTICSTCSSLVTITIWYFKLDKRQKIFNDQKKTSSYTVIYHRWYDLWKKNMQIHRHIHTRDFVFLSPFFFCVRNQELRWKKLYTEQQIGNCCIISGSLSFFKDTNGIWLHLGNKKIGTKGMYSRQTLWLMCIPIVVFFSSLLLSICWSIDINYNTSVPDMS